MNDASLTSNPMAWNSPKESPPSSNDNMLVQVENRFALQGFWSSGGKNLGPRWFVYDIHLGDYIECPRLVTGWRPL